MEQIKNIRLNIDALAGVMTHDLGIGEHFTKAQENLFKAKAWLGECLGQLGTPSPYPSDGKRNTVADIEPTADRAENPSVEDWSDKNDIQKIDWLRQQIGAMKSEVQALVFEGTPSRELNIARTNAWGYLCEARHSLGFQLEKIREVSKA